MNTITINGKSYSGSNISIINGKVFINGSEITSEGKEINIKVEGNIEELKIDACSKLQVTGNITDLKTTSGDVEVSGDVLGTIQTTSGDVNCGNVFGSIKTTSGDVNNRASKVTVPKGWFIAEAGQDPLHMLWFCTLVLFEDFANNTLTNHYSSNENDSFEEALTNCIKQIKQ